MSTVYQHQLHAHKPRRKHYLRWIILVLVLTGGVLFGLHSLKPDTKITTAKVVTKKLTGASATKNWHKGNFSLDLPQSWQFMSVQKDLYTIYHFRSAGSGAEGNRSMDVYEDSNLPNFALNRMVTVEATAEGGLTANAGDVSDNCTAYTTGSTTGRTSVSQLAKWNGIEFLCDMANPLRNVVGTGSKDGLNTVKVNSLSTGAHRYFLTYNEGNDKPDYGIFIAAINSFKVDQ